MSHSTSHRLACLTLATFGLVFAACTDIDDVQRAVSEADSEIATHETIIERSASLTAAHDELDRHAEAIDIDTRRIRSRLDDVDDTCDTDRNGVWTAVFDVNARIDVYLGEAGGLTDLAKLRTATEAYRAEMEARLSSLRRRLDDLPCW